MTPISMDIASIPSRGIRVRARQGECFGNTIEWGPAEELRLVADHSCNPAGEAGVNLWPLDQESPDRGNGFGWAGYDTGTRTWWRYRGEASGGYREHCMQILAVLE